MINTHHLSQWASVPPVGAVVVLLAVAALVVLVLRVVLVVITVLEVPADEVDVEAEVVVLTN